MKKQSFLSKVKRKGKLELIEPSEEICESYLEKANASLKSAKLLFQNNLYENSVSMSYYAMYNSLTALLFKAGIKCENHAGSIIVFNKLFKKTDMFKIISYAKEERIDKQYYVDFILTKESAQDMLLKAEEFLVQIKLMIQNLKTEELNKLRERFKAII